MVSFVFGAHVGTSKHADVFSISLVLPIQQMSRYLDLHCLCADRMAALIRKLQVLLQKEGSTSKCLCEWCPPANCTLCLWLHMTMN